MKSSYNFQAIGTYWQIDINQKNDSPDKLLVKIKALIDEFDRNYSRFRSDSLVTEIYKKKGIYKLPTDAKKMISFYKKLYELTGGIVTPLIGKLMEESGYDSSYSLIPKELHHPPKWKDVIDYKYPNLIVKRNVLLDFGAAGKGYLVDLVGKLLKENRVNNFCIDAGGDILYSSLRQGYGRQAKLKIGLEHPDNESQVIGVISIENESICGSAGNRRRWGKFNHIINPLTLKSVKHIKAIWVISKEAMIADGIATALFFVNPEKLIDDFKFEYIILYNDLSFVKSQGFKAEIFIKENV